MFQCLLRLRWSRICPMARPRCRPAFLLTPLSGIKQGPYGSTHQYVPMHVPLYDRRSGDAWLRVAGEQSISEENVLTAAHPHILLIFRLVFPFRVLFRWVPITCSLLAQFAFFPGRSATVAASADLLFTGVYVSKFTHITRSRRKTTKGQLSAIQ